MPPGHDNLVPNYPGAVLIALAVFLPEPVAAQSGPGLPNLDYPAADVFEIVGAMGGTDAPNQHGTAAMHNGYLVIPFSRGVRIGGFAFYDISDPRSPQLVGRTTHDDAREGHSMGFSYSYPGLYAVTQASFGVHFWDWTDVSNPVLLREFDLPEIEDSDYQNGAWWLFWQAPYVYVGGSSKGLYVIDATDPASPVLLERLPNTETGNFRLGAVFAVGNLLVTSRNDGAGLATMDISNPSNPVLLDTESSESMYSAMVNGDKILLAGSGSSSGVIAFDISDPTDIRFIQKVGVPSKGGYLTFQDGFAHVGASGGGYFKVDIRDPSEYVVVGNGDFTEGSADLDFVSVMGNVAILSDDHGNGTRIMPHQMAPDTTPPAVNMVNPKPGAVNRSQRSRVGLTFTDRIDLRSVDATTFIVRRIGGEGLTGKYSGQTGIVNFSPDVPLEENATYEIIVPAGGIRDYAGNATATEFRSVFSTGPEIVLLDCAIDRPAPSFVGDEVLLRAVDCTDAFEFSWDFGDGSPATPFSASSDVTHTYTSAGHFTVLLTIRQGQNETTVTTVHTVTYPVTGGGATRASTIILDEGRARIWTANPDNDSVTALDADSLAKLFERPVGRHPTTLALVSSDELWVANRDDASVHVLDAGTGQLEETIELPYGSRPHGVAVNPNSSAVYVTFDGTGELAEIDPATKAVTATVDVGPRPRGLAITHDGQRIFVGRHISPADRGEVIEVNVPSFSVSRTYELALDPGPDTDSSSRGVPNYLMWLTISPDGRRLWIPSKKDNTVRGEFVDGQPLTFETSVRTIVSQIDLVTNREDLAARRDIDNRSLAAAVVFSALGDYGYVATLGSNTIEVLDAYSGEPVTGIENVGLAPQGLVLTDNGRLFVHNYMSRDVAVYDVSEVGATNQVPALGRISTVANELLDRTVLLGKQIFYNAFDSRMSRDHYVSCAMCHLDGDSDHRVWDFTDRGEGLRNTPSLRGRAGMRHGPVHWSANFDEIQDFEHDIRGPFGGTGFLDDVDFGAGTRNTPLGDPKAGLSPELDALAAYVASLDDVPDSPYRNADGTLTADALAGEAIFFSAETGCADCHRGPELTDSVLDGSFALSDVGTIGGGSGQRLGEPLEGIDTPTLLGVFDTPPYLHDGSAATLMDVIATANADDEHGKTSHLTDTEKRQLVAYLSQLESSDENCSTPATALASNIYPGSDDADVCPDVTLLWEAVAGAVGYDVYLGEASPGTYRGTVAETSFPATGLRPGRRHFWRVDPVVGVCSTTGEVWSFTTGGAGDLEVVDLNRYSVTTLSSGEEYYSDRQYVVTLPPELEGSLSIQTANDDKGESDESFLTFEITAEAVIYIGYDSRASSLPNWLDDFTDTGLTAGVTDPGQDHVNLYKKTFPPGPLALGANLASGAAGAGSNYLVLLVPTGAGGACDGPRFVRGDANNDAFVDIGDALFVLFHLYVGSVTPPCDEAMDFDNGGTVDQGDAVAILELLFNLGPVPAPPGLECGSDPDAAGSPGDLGCEEHACR